MVKTSNTVYLFIMSSINHANNGGRTALHYAARHGHLVIVEALLQHGATVNVHDHSRQTPLQLAMEYGHIDIALLLASVVGMPSLLTG